MYYRPDFKYKDADFNGTFSEKLTKARDWIRNYKEHHNNLFVCGSTGCGKTYLIMAFLNSLCSEDNFIEGGEYCKDFWSLPVEYIPSKELFDTIKRKFSKDTGVADDAKDDLYRIYNTDLLIIDEFGLGYGTESELIELTELIDHRWKKGLPTVFLSNLGMKLLGEYLKDRARQRAFDNADYVEIKDSSMRKKPKEL